MFDRIVGIFVPFYSELKSAFLLFLVLTRAKVRGSWGAFFRC